MPPPISREQPESFAQNQQVQFTVSVEVLEGAAKVTTNCRSGVYLAIAAGQFVEEEFGWGPGP